MRKLTQRQQEFLGKFLDLYAPACEPLHYTVVAKHLGVGNISAYEMLRLLEARGLVAAEYQLPSGARGPGRPLVLFRPTSLGMQMLTQVSGSEADRVEWERTKAHILEQLKAGKAGDYGALLDELIARTPGSRSVVIYAAEMVTAIILGLESLTSGAQMRSLRDRFREMGKAGEVGLLAFAGLGMGLSLAERMNRRLASFLLVQSARFQEVLSGLSDENRHRLVEFAQEVLQVVER